MPPDSSQYDNSNGGSGFMLGALDFYGSGDDRIAVFDWTGLDNLNSPNCFACGGVHFSGQLFSGVEFDYGEGVLGARRPDRYPWATNAVPPASARQPLVPKEASPPTATASPRSHKHKASSGPR